MGRREGGECGQEGTKVDGVGRRKEERGGGVAAMLDDCFIDSCVHHLYADLAVSSVHRF